LGAVGDVGDRITLGGVEKVGIVLGRLSPWADESVD
jgi:hypothetical protein